MKIEGNGKVRRLFSAAAREDEAADTPAIRRKAPRNVSLMFIRFCSAGVPPAVARGLALAVVSVPKEKPRYSGASFKLEELGHFPMESC